MITMHATLNHHNLCSITGIKQSFKASSSVNNVFNDFSAFVVAASANPQHYPLPLAYSEHWTIKHAQVLHICLFVLYGTQNSVLLLVCFVRHTEQCTV